MSYAGLILLYTLSVGSFYSEKKMNSANLAKLLSGQQLLVEKISSRLPLKECLVSICELIEACIDSPFAKSSILLLDGEQLRHGAAPRLPAAYCEAIDGVQIGPGVGSCGTAAFSKKRIIVSDIASDPFWANFKEIALAHELRACWSTPILSSKKEVLGTFAIYYSKVKEPSVSHLELIDHFTHLSSLAIEREHSEIRASALSAQLLASNEKLKAFTSVIPDLGLVFNQKGDYVDVYGSDLRLLNKLDESIVGKNVKQMLAPELSERVFDTINRTLESNELQLIEYQIQGGTYEARVSALNHYLPEEPDKKHVLWMVRDITERKQSDKQIENLAFYDPLTNLPNRRLFQDRLECYVEKIKRLNEVGALLFFDLDNFKRINDSLGHAIGDQLLLKVASSLQPLLRASDTFARLGGDEFVVLLDSSEADQNVVMDEASHVAQRLLEALSNSYVLNKSSYVIRASIGICLINDADITPDDILKRADSAMYQSKKRGGGQFSFFDPELQRVADLHLQIERDIEHAIERQEFTAYFQPQFGQDGLLCGAEALIRWIHPHKGMISPNDFISIAEQSRVIHRLQDIILRKSCDLVNQLHELDICPEGFTVAINISACQFDTNLEESLCRVLKEYDLSPKYFKLEITESLLMENVDRVIEKIKILKNKGFRFSIDDFGTGYSSLSYLHSFPIDELKIDKSFVDQIAQNGSAIIDAIVSLSENFGFKVVAEGVEEQFQLEVLKQKKVDFFQGFFFARPMPIDEFIDCIKFRQY